MNVYLIRHGETAGNLEKRYIGVTDESLCPAGRAHVQALRACLAENECLANGFCAPSAKSLTVYASPLRRCQETADILFPGQAIHLAEDLRECCFGSFEGHNYAELNGRADYQAWIDSGGELPFPGEAWPQGQGVGRPVPGESKQSFSRRCAQAFVAIAEKEADAENLVLVVHGGTIMAIMEAFARPKRSYYDWMLGPAEGYVCRWHPSTKELEFVKHVSAI